jgi:hypothetical protein
MLGSAERSSEACSASLADLSSVAGLAAVEASRRGVTRSAGDKRANCARGANRMADLRLAMMLHKLAWLCRELGVVRNLTRGHQSSMQLYVKLELRS